MRSSDAHYAAFKRSAGNFEEFARARKVFVRRNLTLAEAQRLCEAFNTNRTPAQIKRGTKMEFESQ